jgi:hypothetical protein
LNTDCLARKLILQEYLIQLEHFDPAGTFDPCPKTNPSSREEEERE